MEGVLVLVLALAAAAVVVGLVWRCVRWAAVLGGALAAYLVACAIWWALVYAGWIPVADAFARPGSPGAFLLVFGPPAIVPALILLGSRRAFHRSARSGDA